MPKYFISFLCFIAILFLAYFIKSKTVTTMQFFPIDEEVTIEVAETVLQMEKNNDIFWTINSLSSEQAYLRQDVSLLYENGKFKGVYSRWKQDVAELSHRLTFKPENSSRLEAISFHHAEVHHSDESITSAQKMSHDLLYIMKKDQMYEAFKKPNNQQEILWEEKLNDMTKQQLLYSWNSLINYFNINQEDYDLIPLTELYHYNTENLPNFTRQQSDEILGKLWEGLYKNYIVLLNEKENRESEHYVPLILFAKDKSHLLVIYELNKQKQKLIQRIPTSSS